MQIAKRADADPAANPVSPSTRAGSHGLFTVSAPPANTVQRGGYEVYGRGGQSLSDRWEDGVRTLHGMQAHGFRNLYFIVSITQSGFTVNFTHMLGETGKHLAYIINAAIDKGYTTIEASEKAEAEWVQTILDRSMLGGEFQQTGTPSHYNNEGKPGEVSRQAVFFLGGPTEFLEMLEEYRADGGLQGLEVKKESKSKTAA